MSDFFDFLGGHNFLGRHAWVLMIVAVVFIGNWFGYRHRELKFHEEMRIREMEHQRKMKELELELEKARAQRERVNQ